MKKFIVIYNAPVSAMEQTEEASPEEKEKGMELWYAWAKKIGSGLVDMGNPLGNGRKMTQSGSSPSDSEAAGYSILQAEDMEEALALLEGHPHLGWDARCSIEVYEAFPLPE